MFDVKPVKRLLRTLAQARADDHGAGMSVAGVEQARDVVGGVLAVAVHRQHRLEAAAQCLGETIAQARALAHAPGVP